MNDEILQGLLKKRLEQLNVMRDARMNADEIQREIVKEIIRTREYGACDLLAPRYGRLWRLDIRG